MIAVPVERQPALMESRKCRAVSDRNYGRLGEPLLEESINGGLRRLIQ
jgi:hypothetical protein